LEHVDWIDQLIRMKVVTTFLLFVIWETCSGEMNFVLNHYICLAVVINRIYANIDNFKSCTIKPSIIHVVLFAFIIKLLLQREMLFVLRLESKLKHLRSILYPTYIGGDTMQAPKDGYFMYLSSPQKQRVIRFNLIYYYFILSSYLPLAMMKTQHKLCTQKKSTT
jgi:hypothetical protein